MYLSMNAAPWLGQFRTDVIEVVPEEPLFPASEVYGLGVVLHALLSTQSLGAIPRERDAHDDAIVDKLLAIDWTDLQRLPGATR